MTLNFYLSKTKIPIIQNMKFFEFCFEIELFLDQINYHGLRVRSIPREKFDAMLSLHPQAENLRFSQMQLIKLATNNITTFNFLLYNNFFIIYRIKIQ